MPHLGSADKKTWTKLNYAVELARMKALAKSLELRAKTAHRMKHPEHGKALAAMADKAQAEVDRMKDKKEMSGLGAPEAPASAEDLKAQLQKAIKSIKAVRAAMKAAKSKESRQAYVKQAQALKVKIRKIQRLLQQHRGDVVKRQGTVPEEIEAPQETELSGPLDAVGGFVCRRPITSLAMAAIAGALISRRM